MEDTAFTGHTPPGREQRRLQNAGHGGPARPLNSDMAPPNNFAALAAAKYAVPPVFPHDSGDNTNYQFGSPLWNSQPSPYLPSQSSVSLYPPFQTTLPQALDPTNIHGITFAHPPPLQSSVYGNMETTPLGIQGDVPSWEHQHAAVQQFNTDFSSATGAEADLYEGMQVRTAIQTPMYGSMHTPTTLVGSSAISPYRFQDTPQRVEYSIVPQLIQEMGPADTRDRSYSLTSSLGLPDPDLQLTANDPLFSELGHSMDNRGIASYRTDSMLLGINNDGGYSPVVVSNSIGMARSNSQTRSVTSGHSYWPDGTQISSISSAAAYPTGSPSNSCDPRQHTGQNLKRGASDAVLENSSGSQPTSKRIKSDKDFPASKACTACYLAHKPCIRKPGSESCDKCAAPDSSYPVCVSSSIKTKDFFTDCLGDAEKSLVEATIAIITKGRERPATAALAEKVNRETDLKSMMEVLSEYKVQHPNAYAVFFEDHGIKNHPIFGPFYQVNLILQARSLLHRETTKRYITYVESDLLVLRAIYARRLFKFIEKNFEKNKQPANMPKGSQQARNFVVFLAMSLEQILAYEKTTDTQLSYDQDKKRTDLVYHLAYLLRHISKATFPNSTLSSDIHVGPDDKGGHSGVRLEREFWDHLHRLYFDTSANNTDGAQSSAPRVIISPPTNPAGNEGQMSSTDVSPVGSGSARLVSATRRRRGSVEKNDGRDDADATSLLEARMQTEESAVGQLIVRLEETHLSRAPQEMYYHVGYHTNNAVWDSGLPAEASGSGISGGHGDGEAFGIGTPDATGGIVGTGHMPGTIIGTSNDLGTGMGSFSFRSLGHVGYGASYDSSFSIEGTVAGSLPADDLVDSYSDTRGICGVSEVSGMSRISGRSYVPENMRGHVGNADGAASAGTAGMADADADADANFPGRGIRGRLKNGKNMLRRMVRRTTGK